MPGKTLQVKLTAKDELSAALAKAGNGATKLSAALEQTGSAGKATARDLGRTTKSAEEMQSRMADAYRGGQQLGIGLLAIGAASVAAGKMFRDQEIAIETLRRGYDDAADDLLQFADAMQQSTNFSNDAIVATENIFRTLAENYGFTADQIR